MGIFLGSATISITLALIFYSIGTWSEHFQKGLRLWHIVFFVLGLCADSLGTAMMMEIADPMKQNFSKFSIFVWTFWLIPYILGIVLGIK